MLSAANVLNRLGGFLLHRRRAAQPQSASGAQAAPGTGSPTENSQVERRQSPRRYGNPIQVLIADGRLTDESPRAWVMDRSAGGLGLASAQPFSVGANLGVRVTNAPPNTPIVYVQVKACNAKAGRWFLNCQFITTPPQEVMLLFR